MNTFKSHLSTASWLGVIFLLLPLSSNAQEESMVLDPITGDYILTYQGYAGWQKVVYTPLTKIVPVVRSKYKEREDGAIIYSYAVKNTLRGQQELAGMRMFVRSVYVDSLVTPGGWNGLAKPIIPGDLPIVSWITWGDESFPDALAIGKTQNGFSVTSSALPGIASMNLWGDGMAPAFPDEGPDPDSEVGKAFNQLYDNNFVRRYVAAPMIAVPEHFNAAVVLMNLQKHVEQDLLSQKLVDPVFAQQLNRRLESAIAAAQGGNKTALHADIKALRKLLYQEHGDMERAEDDDDDTKQPRKKPALIDKLSARVLDFDLKYIAKRIGEAPVIAH